MISRGDTTDGRGGALGKALATLLRQFWTIVLIVGTGSLASLAYSRMQAPNFEATAIVQVRPGADIRAAQDRLTSRQNLMEVVMRHRSPDAEGEIDLIRSAVQLRQSISVRELTSEVGTGLGFAPDVTGIAVSVLMADAELSARIANDLAQQILDEGNAGSLQANQNDLIFYRREEQRLWQETSALRAEIAAMQASGSIEAAERQLADARRVALLQDQYDLVRGRLAALEVDSRLAAESQAGQFSLLQRATATDAVRVLRNWMLVGVAGSLLLAVALAFVLDRRYPALQRGPWDDLAAAWPTLARAYRLVDDPARPVLGLPRFAVVSGGVVVVLIGAAALLR